MSRHGTRAGALGRRAGIFAIVLAGLLGGAAAMAADDEKVIFPGASRTDSPTGSAGTGASSILLLVGIALAGGGGWWVLRTRRGVKVGRDPRNLAVDETRSLGNRQYLVVASYAGQKFLIGVCPGRIDMLAPLGQPGEVRRPGA